MVNNILFYIICVCTVYYYAFQSIILLAWQHANVKFYILRKKSYFYRYSSMNMIHEYTELCSCKNIMLY